MHTRALIAALIVTIGLAVHAGPCAAADVQIGVNVAIPAPPVVLAPPALVVVPNSPVHYVPTADFNLFVYRNHYYSFHHGRWFASTGPKAPWAVIAVEAVPAPVRAVPVKHYKIPPGQARKMEAHPGGWCPPGQAKKGRC
jgi:hypothetical protein